jgi:hypothetical protein
MPDEHDAFDLSELLRDNHPDWTDLNTLEKVDRSGKPKPVNVRVQLDSGIEIKCEVRYTGINPVDGDRLFTVIAEIDWENYRPTMLLVEEMPNDVEFRFRVAGLPDELDEEFCAGLTLIPERIIKVK